MDEEDCGKRYLCELAAGDALDEEQRTLSFFQVFFATFGQILYLNPFKLFMKKKMLPHECARRLKRLRIFVFKSHIGNVFEDA